MLGQCLEHLTFHGKRLWEIRREEERKEEEKKEEEGGEEGGEEDSILGLALFGASRHR
jgi:hypothetical protein